jgi:hypothetical protein
MRNNVTHLYDMASRLLECDTRITDSGLAHLKELRNLKYLFVHDASITGLGFRDMSCNVEYLFARDTRLDVACEA